MSKYRLKELGKTIEYLLLHRPDEFGLFLNDDGSLPIRELMWALHEEPKWKHVRLGHLRELAYSGLELAFAVEAKYIMPKHDPSHTAPGAPPRLLFFAARRKTYPVILKQGLKPGSRSYVPLATNEDMATRIGKRRDPKPVLLTIHAAQAHDSNRQFLRCGELLYLVQALPFQFISGPPLREKPEPRKAPRPQPITSPELETWRMPGSFFLDLSKDPDPARRRRRLEQDERKRQLSRERRRKRRGR